MFRAIALLAALLLWATPLLAQTPTDNAAATDVSAFRASIANVRFAPPARPPLTSVSRPGRVARERMSIPKRIVLTAVAGFGGLYAGGIIGARIDGECGGCDDPGMKGALIGMPIGAASAAIVTWILSGR